MDDERKQLRSQCRRACGTATATAIAVLITLLVVLAHSVSASTDQHLSSAGVHPRSIDGVVLSDGGTVFTFLRDAADVIDFQPRWQSENWSTPHIWFHIYSTFTNSGACLLLAGILARIYRMHPATSYAKTTLLFCAFFLAGGITHFLEGLMFWWPAYRLNTLALTAEGIFSIAVAAMVARIAPQLVSLRSSAEIQQEIVQRRRTELELRKVHAQLEGVIEQRTAELASKNEEMEQFLNTVSHDLKSPIVTCLGLVTSLREDIQAGHLEDSNDTINRIERSATRMRRLIEDLLNLSRLGKVRFELADVDTNSIIRSICEEFKPRVAKVNAALDLETDLPHLRADPHWLTEVFENLITNAIKYGCDNPKPRITLGCVSDSNEHRFYVRDNGHGIDPANHARIFEPFRRLQTDKEGSGMGLAIVVRIIKMHGGRIWIESQVGQGATFWIALPVSNSHDSNATKEPQHEQQREPLPNGALHAA
jgi:signal transduction histidine kinase